MNNSLYNPDSMSKEDIKTLFVARQPLLDELVLTIRNQPQGAGVQHLLIIAPRGMGKTTMLLMAQFAAEDDKKLSKDWQAVRFPEESYGITELADFWLKVLQHLVDATNDKDFEIKIEEIKKRFTKSEDLRESAWALVKDWSKKHKKRILLLVDNFDMILDQIGNDTEQARLRDILMNDGTIMFIGGASSYFHQIQNYEQPLYNFFKIHNLSDLKFADIEDLLRRRAELDEIENIEELLQKNRTRIKALETFTGGNPRLVLMLYRIITSSDMTEVTKGLESLLDAVTPLYKDKTEKLPTQQKKIINEIAQYSLEKREGISPTEIAKRIRMTPNQVSSQLKRLAENGYVKALNIRGRSSFYVLSEPLYAIWAQMRFGRNAREKRNWLVQILKTIFDVQEIQIEIQKASEKYTKLQDEGREQKARGTLEYLMCLLETDEGLMQNNFSLAIYGYLELDEISSIKAELNFEKITKLPIELIELLKSKNVLNETDLERYKNKLAEELLANFMSFIGNVMSEFTTGKSKKSFKDIEEVILVMEQANYSDYKVLLAVIYAIKATMLCSFKRYEESIVNSDKVTQILTKYEANGKEFFAIFEYLSYFAKATSLTYLNKLDEALISFDQVLHLLSKEIKLLPKEQVNKLKTIVYSNKIKIQFLENRIEEATSSLKQYLDFIKTTESGKWVERGFAELTHIATVVEKKIFRKVIEENNLGEEFFPLIRAIDYLETKDETLIEKLSPEVRLVVEETIRTLQMVAEEKSEPETKQKAKNKKDRKSEKSLALSK